jgi:hypothetical protein
VTVSWTKFVTVVLVDGRVVWEILAVTTMTVVVADMMEDEEDGRDEVPAALEEGDMVVVGAEEDSDEEDDVDEEVEVEVAVVVAMSSPSEADVEALEVEEDELRDSEVEVEDNCALLVVAVALCSKVSDGLKGAMNSRLQILQSRKLLLQHVPGCSMLRRLASCR